MPKAEIGLIGGSGFYKFFAKPESKIDLRTRFGSPSARISVGKIAGKKVAFIPRHGLQHTLPPHRVPYRANIFALKQLGVETIIAPCSVGSLKKEIAPGDFVICDQFIDRTRKRKDTFFDGPKVAHLSSAYPYCGQLREIAIGQLKKLQFSHREKGTVVVIEGPRFSTLSESRWFSENGWDVINMTQYPEAVLAGELGMCYLNISLVTDYDAGIYAEDGAKPVSIEEVMANFAKNIEKMKELILEIIENLPQEKTCSCLQKAQQARL